MSLLSFAATSPGMLLAGLSHYWVAWLVAAQYSPLARHRKLLDSVRMAVRWSVCAHVCVCNSSLIITLSYCYVILSQYCHECKHCLLLAGRLIVARGLKNSNGLNRCGVFVEPEFRMCCSELFVKHFPRLLFSSLSPAPSPRFFVVGGENEAFWVKWPVFDCSRCIMLNCSNKLIWGGVCVCVHVAECQHWQLWTAALTEVGTFFFCQFPCIEICFY